ncbi:helix-turn-helix domain-containing protein [Streptomyces millisiae]
MSVADLAARCGLAPERIDGLESGEEWVDRRGSLAVLSSALRLDPGELTGQPYPPAGEEHGQARAVAFHLRRAIAKDRPAGAVAVTVEELAARTEAVAADAAGGDEQALAAGLPGLISDSDALLAMARAAQRDRVAQLRGRVHVVAAGLLRRLGYRDLAWLLLHRAWVGAAEPPAVLVEEVRLLIDMGLPEYALARAERAGSEGREEGLPLLVAFAHAMAGRPGMAARVLQVAGREAGDAAAAARVAAARVAVAVECGEVEEAAEGARSLDVAALEPAGRVGPLVAAAAAEARREDIGQAAAWLRAAEEAAPLWLRLDPFARELLTALPARTGGTAEAALLHQMAARAGLR